MCGISGLLKLDGSHWDINHCPAELRVMMDKLRHRGPDSSGVYVDGPIAMGINRLAVMDPGPRADQPVISRDKRYIIVFNGEIYNYRILRNQLEKEGFCFSTTCDTEVLLALYTLKGEDCLDDIRGMYAFAVWDKQEQSLFLARDRIGEKPLVYYHDDKFFIFSSELPSLLAAQAVKRKIDPIGVHMAMYYMHSIAPQTVYKNIYKLPPAHSMRISNSSKEIKQYWNLDCSISSPFSDINECAEELRRCFDETVSLMCNSDVPIGAALSGGLDSSAVVSSMRRKIDPFPTFRISSGPDGNTQEADSAQKVARFFQTDHHEYTISPSDMRLFEEIIQRHGEPIVSPVPIDAYLLAKKMKQHVTVALCGAGSDELFGGYPSQHEMATLDHHFARFREIEEKAQAININMEQDRNVRNAWNIYQKVGNRHPEQYFGFMRSQDQGIYKKIYSEPMLRIIEENDPAEICARAYTQCRATSLFNGFIGQQLHCVSQYSTSEINDRTAMAHSLEIRSPFLDVEMIELACRIPVQYKIGHDRNGPVYKNVLKLAMQDRLPPETINCPKLPFGGTIPYRQWFMEDNSDFFDEKLQNHALADSGLFNMDGIRELQLLYDCGAEIPWNPLLGVIAISIWLDSLP